MERQTYVEIVNQLAVILKGNLQFVELAKKVTDYHRIYVNGVDKENYIRHCFLWESLTPDDSRMIPHILNNYSSFSFRCIVCIPGYALVYSGNLPNNHLEIKMSIRKD